MKKKKSPSGLVRLTVITPMQFTRLAAFGLALTLPLGACAGGDGGGEEKATEKEPTAEMTTTVAVKDFVFSPKAIQVKAGDTVTWTNEDEFDHSVLIDALDLESPNFGPQTMPVSYSHQFSKAGTYEYLCGVHNSMTGTVIVTN